VSIMFPNLLNGIHEYSRFRSYVRQVQACKLLGGRSGDHAKESLSRALHQQELKNNVVLVDMFIMLLTDDKGLPEDKVAFEQWHEGLMKNEKSRSLVHDLGGFWQKKIDDHTA
jgi:hypothetical protein